MLQYFLAVLISFTSTFFLVPVMQKVAQIFGALDIPDGVVKQHETPTPYLGGIALYGGFLTSLFFVFSFNNTPSFFLGITAFLCIGLADDIIVFSPLYKFLAQCIVALCYVKAGLHFKVAFFSSGLNNIVSFFWILFIVNGFNLIDIMDGLAALVAIVATATFLLTAFMFNLKFVALLLCSFFGSLLAFFSYNKPKASIYLGDSGAHLIGGFLASAPFLYNWSCYGLGGFCAPLFILIIPLLEIFFLIVIRSCKGIAFYKSSKHHFIFYLKRRNYSVHAILIFTFLVSVTASIFAACAALNYVSFLTIVFAAIVFFCFFLIFVFLKKN